MARPFTDGTWFTDEVDGRLAGWLDPVLDLLDSDLFAAVRGASKLLIAVVEIEGYSHESGEFKTWHFSGGWKSFTTSATDTPPNTFMPARISRNFVVNREIPWDSNGKLRGIIETRISEISIVNSDGEYDELATNWIFDGRPVRIRMGALHEQADGTEVLPVYADFIQVFEGVVGTSGRDGARQPGVHVGVDEVVIRVSDKSTRLLGQAQEEAYRGTGDEHGDAELSGVRKPLAIGGLASHVPAPLINPTSQIYQASSGPLQTLEVHDRGIRVPLAQTYPDYNTLRLATVPPGQTATVPSRGLFKLGSPTSGPVTATVRHMLSQPHNVGTVVKWVLINLGGFDESELNTSFDTFVSSAAIGYWLAPNQDMSVLRLIEELAAGHGAVVGAGRDGQYRILRIDLPGEVPFEPGEGESPFDPSPAPFMSFGEGEIHRIERLALPYGVPPFSWSVTYQKMWRIFSESDIAGGVAPSTKSLLMNEWRVNRLPPHPEIKELYPTSYAFPDVTAYYTGTGPAEAEAKRLRVLYAPGRTLYRATVKTALFMLDIGQTVRVTYPRYDLHEGKDFVIIGLSDDFGSVETEMLLFGGDAIEIGEPPEIPVELSAPVATDDILSPIAQSTGHHDVDVLANDIFSGTPAIAILLQSGPGTATVVGTGTASRIRVPLNNLGTKSLLYELTATGNSGANKAIMSVEITGTPDPAPVANDDVFSSVLENSGIYDLDVLANDTFAGTPTISIVSQTGPGTATVVNSGASSRIRVPTASGAGTKTVTYRLTATGNSGDDTALMTVPIQAQNVAPVANNDAFPAVQEDTGSHDFHVLANDVYSGTPTISIVSQTGPGTATVVNSGANSRIRVPTTSGSGTKTVTYSLSATLNTGSDQATMTVVIQASAPESTYVADGYVATGYVV